MGGLLQAIRSVFGGGDSGGPDQQQPGPETGGLDQDKALQYTLDKWNDLKNSLVVYHQSIWQSLLFYAGQLWIDWDDARKVWQPQQPTDEWVPRPRINRFAPTIDSVASNFYQMPPIEAVPKKEKQSDPEAYTIADISSDLIAYAVVKEGLEAQHDEEEDKAGLAAQFYVLAGTVFSLLRKNKKSLGQKPKSKIGPAFSYQCDMCDKFVTAPAGPDAQPPKFCPNCGNPIEPQSTDSLQPELGPDGQPAMEDISEWDISLDIGSPLYAFPRAGSTSLADSPFLLWSQRRNLDEIYFRWNKYEADADAEWPDGYSVTYEYALNFWYLGYANSTLQIKDSCMTHEMYVAPNKVKDFPQGFYQVAINKKSVICEPWDFPEHPVTMGKYLTFPTVFFGRAVSFDLVEVQREDIKYESIKSLHGMTAAVDPVVVEADSMVSEISGRADKIIKWRRLSPDAEPPHRMGHGSLDDGIYKQGEILQQEYRNISGATAAFKGESEYAGEPAAAAKLRREQAELQFGKPAANWRGFWRETMRKYVKFLQKYYTLEQLAQILGAERLEDIKAWQQADLDNTVDFLASSTSLPRTKEEIKDELIQLGEMGVIDPNDPSVRQRIYEVAGETGLDEDFNDDATNARLENQAFKTGSGDPSQPGQYVPPQIHPMIGIEDLMVHLYFHKRQAKSRDFQRWNPDAQQALLEHIMETTQAIAMSQPPQPMLETPPNESPGVRPPVPGQPPTSQPGAAQ